MGDDPEANYVRVVVATTQEHECHGGDFAGGEPQVAHFRLDGIVHSDCVGALELRDIIEAGHRAEDGFGRAVEILG